MLSASKSTPMWSLKGMELPAKVISVYDGDTFNAAVPLHGSVYQIKVRLAGIDTPEIKSKTPEAYRARNRLVGMLTDCEVGCDDERCTNAKLKTLVGGNRRLVTLRCQGEDKYGRCLADVVVDGASASEVLLREGLAKAYDGGKKEAWS